MPANVAGMTDTAKAQGEADTKKVKLIEIVFVQAQFQNKGPEISKPIKARRTMLT